MHWKLFFYNNALKSILQENAYKIILLENALKNYFTKNALRIILLWKFIKDHFTIKVHWKLFYNKNTLNFFIIKMHWKLSYFKNTLKIILLSKSMIYYKNTIHCMKSFCNKNVLKMILCWTAASKDANSNSNRAIILTFELRL